MINNKIKSVFVFAMIAIGAGVLFFNEKKQISAIDAIAASQPPKFYAQQSDNGINRSHAGRAIAVDMSANPSNESVQETGINLLAIKSMEETPGVSMEITEREMVIQEWDKNHHPKDPDNNNYDVNDDSPYSAEINLYNSDNDCVENCAESLTELMPASGDYADQINDDALLAQAAREGITDSVPGIALKDPAPSTGPPVD